MQAFKQAHTQSKADSNERSTHRLVPVFEQVYTFAYMQADQQGQPMTKMKIQHKHASKDNYLQACKQARTNTCMPAIMQAQLRWVAACIVELLIVCAHNQATASMQGLVIENQQAFAFIQKTKNCCMRCTAQYFEYFIQHLSRPGNKMLKRTFLPAPNHAH